MLHLIRSLSPRTEFILVLTISYAYFALASLYGALLPDSAAIINNASLWWLAKYELLILILLTGFLGSRTWTFRAIGLDPNLRDTAIGLGMALATYFTYELFLMAFAELLGKPPWSECTICLPPI